ncbi:MAG: hypothetical protein QXX41_07950 [Nitrososphaerota archaeon]
MTDKFQSYIYRSINELSVEKRVAILVDRLFGDSILKIARNNDLHSSVVTSLFKLAKEWRRCRYCGRNINCFFANFKERKTFFVYICPFCGRQMAKLKRKPPLALNLLEPFLEVGE